MAITPSHVRTLVSAAGLFFAVATVAHAQPPLPQMVQGKATAITFDKDGKYSDRGDLDVPVAPKTRRIKLYTLAAERGAVYELEAGGPNAPAPLLIVFGPDNKMVAPNAKEGGAVANSRRVFTAEQAGDYRIGVIGRTTKDTTFTFTARRTKAGEPVAGGQKPPEKNRVAFGANSTYAVADQLTNNDPAIPGSTKRHKPYKITMEKGGIYRIDLKSRDFDAYLILQGPNGQTVASNDDFGGTFDSRIIYTAPAAGEYRILATVLVQGTGAYSFSVVREHAGEPLAKVDPARPVVKPAMPDNGRVELGGTGGWSVDSKLAAGDPVKNGKHGKEWVFPVEKGAVYQIDMRSGAFDSYLFLENAAGQIIAADDDGGGYPNARIAFTAADTGDYRIRATYFSGGIGPFTLTVRQTKAGEFTSIQPKDIDPKDPRNTKVILDPAGTYAVKGKLSASEPVVGGKRERTYAFPMEKGAVYRIFLKSADFDAYLVLESPDGRAAAVDDDSGGGRDAMILHTAEATGEHRVRVTSLDEGAMGNYTLLVRRERVAP